MPNAISERPASSLRDLIKEKPPRPHSTLLGLLDASPSRSEPVSHESALKGVLGVQK